jgi:hypothetical protein
MGFRKGSTHPTHAHALVGWAERSEAHLKPKMWAFRALAHPALTYGLTVHIR